MGWDATTLVRWFNLNVHTWSNYKSLFKKAQRARDTLLARPLMHGVAEHDEARNDRDLLSALLLSGPQQPLRAPHELYDPSHVQEKRMTDMGYAAFERLVKKYV